jgi:hypothetical protein
MGLIEKKEKKSIEDMEETLVQVIPCLEAYEDSGLTADQVMDLSEAVEKLERYFGDKITVNQVVDFFVDFYVAQGDPERTEEAELLTNEDVTRYRELKVRDTAKTPVELDGPWYKCPTCGKYAGGLKGNFCHVCGQRLKWED